MGGAIVHHRQGKDRNQHQQASHQGVDHEFHRGIDPSALSPDTDEKISRHQHQLPKHIKQNSVEGQKHPKRPRLQCQHQGHKVPEPFLLAKGKQKGDESQKSSQHNHPQTYSIYPYQIIDIQGRHPVKRLDKLHIRVRGIKRKQ